MYYFFFYDGDVQIGEGYGLDPADAIIRYCERHGFEAMEGITPVCVLSRSEWDHNPWKCATA